MLEASDGEEIGSKLQIEAVRSPDIRPRPAQQIIFVVEDDELQANGTKGDLQEERIEQRTKERSERRRREEMEQEKETRKQQQQQHQQQQQQQRLGQDIVDQDEIIEEEVLTLEQRRPSLSIEQRKLRFLVKQGYLLKQCPSFLTFGLLWQKRYFVLTPQGVIYYYLSKEAFIEGVSHRGSISICDIRCEAVETDACSSLDINICSNSGSSSNNLINNNDNNNNNSRTEPVLRLTSNSHIHIGVHAKQNRLYVLKADDVDRKYGASGAKGGAEEANREANEWLRVIRSHM